MAAPREFDINRIGLGWIRGFIFFIVFDAFYVLIVYFKIVKPLVLPSSKDFQKHPFIHNLSGASITIGT